MLKTSQKLLVPFNDSLTVPDVLLKHVSVHRQDASIQQWVHLSTTPAFGFAASQAAGQRAACPILCYPCPLPIAAGAQARPFEGMS